MLVSGSAFFQTESRCPKRPERSKLENQSARYGLGKYPGVSVNQIRHSVGADVFGDHQIAA
jgi:hypothetical protein